MTTEVKDVVGNLRHAITTAANDDLSEPMTEKRSRHVARMAAMEEAASLLESLSSQVNKYAYERDKAREERDTAERRSEAFWKPQFINAESRATAAEGRVALLEEALTEIAADATQVMAKHDPLGAEIGMSGNEAVRRVNAFVYDAAPFISTLPARARLAKGGQS